MLLTNNKNKMNRLAVFVENGKLDQFLYLNSKVESIDDGKIKIARTFDGHTSDVRSVSFSSDGKYICSGSLDKTVRLWDIHTGENIRTFEGHTDRVNCVSFSPDGKYICSGSGDIYSRSGDNTVRLWNVDTGENIRTLNGHTDLVWSVSFSPDGKYICSGSDDTTVRLWEIPPPQYVFPRSITDYNHNGTVFVNKYSGEPPEYTPNDPPSHYPPPPNRQTTTSHTR